MFYNHSTIKLILLLNVEFQALMLMDYIFKANFNSIYRITSLKWFKETAVVAGTNLLPV